jgi:hypothetical protein
MRARRARAGDVEGGAEVGGPARTRRGCGRGQKGYGVKRGCCGRTSAGAEPVVAEPQAHRKTEGKAASVGRESITKKAHEDDAQLGGERQDDADDVRSTTTDSPPPKYEES